jgi:hypothetical protein
MSKRPLKLVKVAEENDGDVLTPQESNGERALTVNGKPIPLEFAHLIAFEATDQGIAEREAALEGKPRACVQFISDEWDKTLQQREAATSTWDSPDPMRDAIESVREPGMAYKFLSPRVTAKKGLRRYEVVHKNGEPVKVGEMVLGAMPEDLRRKRNAHYQAIGNDDLRQVEQQYQADLHKAVRDGGLSQGEALQAILRSGDELHDHRNPDRGAQIGVRITRGSQAA